MRPESHREQIPEKRCGNCFWAIIPEYKRDLLCFHGDDDRLTINCPGLRSDTTDIDFDGECVGTMDGEEYDNVWGGRTVHDTDICDEWQPQAAEAAEEE